VVFHSSHKYYRKGMATVETTLAGRLRFVEVTVNGNRTARSLSHDCVTFDINIGRRTNSQQPKHPHPAQQCTASTLLLPPPPRASPIPSSPRGRSLNNVRGLIWMTWKACSVPMFFLHFRFTACTLYCCCSTQSGPNAGH